MDNRQFSFFSALTAIKLCLSSSHKFPYFDERSLGLLARRGHKICFEKLRPRNRSQLPDIHAIQEKLGASNNRRSNTLSDTKHKTKLLSAFSLGADYQGIRMHFQQASQLELFPCNTSDLLLKLIPDLNDDQHLRISSQYEKFWLDFMDYETNKRGRKNRYRVYSLWGCLGESGLGEPLGFYLIKNNGDRLWFSALTYLLHQQDEIPFLH